MNENLCEKVEPTNTRISLQSGSRSKWVLSWVTLLSDVFLFAASLNCLFRWMAYGHVYDGAALALSLALALVVYFLALNSQRVASLNSRTMIAVTGLLAWAVLLPVVMRLAGHS